ncbi:MAG: hypothetical protein M3P18_14705 [Actinomycetota bacterium]|nr:hypothetical protein [Actinomycetota bacterium]
MVYQSRAGLNLLPLSDGKPRELIRFTQDTRVINWGWRIAFTPDSRSVVFGGAVHGESGMWIISIGGGEPRKIKTDVDVDAVGVWRFNPKTWEVAFTISNRPQYEVRKMENFLPTSGRKR